MLILPSEADEALVSTAVDRITKIITPTGGEVTKLDRWGRKRFAYEIADQNEGYYVVARFSAERMQRDYLELYARVLAGEPWYGEAKRDVRDRRSV